MGESCCGCLQGRERRAFIVHPLMLPVQVLLDSHHQGEETPQLGFSVDTFSPSVAWLVTVTPDKMSILQLLVLVEGYPTMLNTSLARKLVTARDCHPLENVGPCYGKPPKAIHVHIPQPEKHKCVNIAIMRALQNLEGSGIMVLCAWSRWGRSLRLRPDAVVCPALVS